MKVKHKGQKREKYYMTEIQNCRDGRGNEFRGHGKSVCKKQLVKWPQRWRNG